MTPNPAAPQGPATHTAHRPSILFVCVKNGGKSQMAQALMRQLAGDSVRVTSGGTHPGTALNALAVQSLEAVGASVAGQSPQLVTPELMRAADRVVVLGQEAQLPEVEGVRVERWITDEPSLRGIEGMERMELVRDDIRARVAELLVSLR
ncbi:arsenate-mycothiol transferase ArsC [Galactobacter caseinivorans]|uniref:Low molecular weight phosphatase family protein n=1 Tax=Galactobacter caseinivorans TaxID=2676123 RepID=A0A496PLD4_9MICC|nr:low molecular weight phosphatase family protein [Galactobacter caseinivorans]RKW71361.1 low molecular weight phosphatase family protein [Galactobacter caseinivorans]